MKGKMLIVLACSTAMICGCSKAGAPTNDSAAVANIAADKQTIDALIARWVQLIQAKDAAAIAQLYAEDGALMPPNTPIARGREAIRQTWQSMMATPGFSLNIENAQLDFSASGDMAIDRGTYRLAASPASGPIEETGKYVVVWRKVGGEWKAAADIFNSDQPAEG